MFNGKYVRLATGVNAAAGVTVSFAVDTAEVLGLYVYCTHGGAVTQTLTYTEDTHLPDNSWRKGPVQTLAAAGSTLTSAASATVWSHRYPLQVVACNRLSVTFLPSGATMAYELGYFTGAQREQ